MYIIVFADSNYVRKPDIETAFSLPGEKHIFSIGKNLVLSKPDGICYYNKDKEVEKFKLNHLELVDVSRMSSNHPFTFSIYNHNTNTIQHIKPKSTNIEYALPEAIKEIVSASNFSNWNDYEAMLNIENFKNQIKELQSQLDFAKQQYPELENKINQRRK